MQQQTILKVQTNRVNPLITGTTYEYQNLDLYPDIPIKINRSFAELQDIASKNSDYSIGVLLPGSKINNSFFENFFNVDQVSLYFNPTLRTPCKVLIEDQIYFDGYLKLNKISVKNSAVEYDVTLYSNIGDLFGKIGNNLLKDLDYDDVEHQFNHIFQDLEWFSPFKQGYTNPNPYFYPIIHNGYIYSGDTVNFSGGTYDDQSRLFTTTGPINTYNTPGDAYAAGVEEYRLNSPLYGIFDNQLKPALSIWHLIELMFKTYGYSIKSDFFNTPWFKGLYMYGYFNSEYSKFSYITPPPVIYPSSGIDILITETTQNIPETGVCTGEIDKLVTRTFYVVKKGTGIPCLSSDFITIYDTIHHVYQNIDEYYTQTISINPKTTGATYNYYSINYFDQGICMSETKEIDVTTIVQPDIGFSMVALNYVPLTGNDIVIINDGDPVDFSLIIQSEIKQIDLLSSIAKKFNLVFTPDPDNSSQIIIEPYDYYIGTGNVLDWTDKLSYDKGFSVEPAQNYIESDITLTDLEDGDDGNIQFKNKNNRVYGQNIVTNQTDFKSSSKKIETIFSPELIRKWDNNVDLPLGLNYVSSSSEQNTQVIFQYKGVKTKPKLFFYLGNFNLFVNDFDIVADNAKVNTNVLRIGSSTYPIQYTTGFTAPVISHTMPIGGFDSVKLSSGFENDTLCILFNSELPTDSIGVKTYPVYTDEDIYQKFYSNRINNIYSPNTRFLDGYFDLKLSDIQNLKPNDLIKINEQYFTWNKIDSFNLTNKELTKVELIQFNGEYKTYPTRYFKYSYCANFNEYVLKTDFINPKIGDTNYWFSVQYDFNSGVLGHNTGFTMTYQVPSMSGLEYVPITLTEITKDFYDNGTDWSNDPEQITLKYYGFPYWRSEWITDNNSGVNVFIDCTDFYTKAITYSIPIRIPIT